MQGLGVRCSLIFMAVGTGCFNQNGTFMWIMTLYTAQILVSATCEFIKLFVMFDKSFTGQGRRLSAATLMTLAAGKRGGVHLELIFFRLCNMGGSGAMALLTANTIFSPGTDHSR